MRGLSVPVDAKFGAAEGVAAVVLAAGLSRRLGTPKQTLVLGGQTLVERAVRTALAAGLSPVMVVVRPECAFAAGLQQLGCVMVVNPEADEGMASSIRCGVAVAAEIEAKGIVLLTCDQIAVSPSHLRELCAQPGTMMGSGYVGRVGIPAYFPSASFADLLQLQGDIGARTLLRDALFVRTEELALDVDCKEDIALAEEWLQRQEACR